MQPPCYECMLCHCMTLVLLKRMRYSDDLFDSLGCGTTWHSVGLLGRLRENELLYNMTSYGFELYSNLEEDSGLSTGII